MFRKVLQKMTRRLVLLGSLVAVMCALMISISVVFADTNENDVSENRFAVRIAAILGLDETQVTNAMDQAHRELMAEFAESKLNALVENGKMTRDEADEKLNSMESNSNYWHLFGRHRFGSMYYGKDVWKNHDKGSWKTKDKDLGDK